MTSTGTWKEWKEELEKVTLKIEEAETEDERRRLKQELAGLIEDAQNLEYYGEEADF